MEEQQAQTAKRSERESLQIHPCRRRRKQVSEPRLHHLHRSERSRGFMAASSAASLRKAQPCLEGVRSSLPITCFLPLLTSYASTREVSPLLGNANSLHTEWGRGVAVFPSHLHQVTRPPAKADKRKRRAELAWGRSLLGNMTGACRPRWPPTGANRRGFVWPTCSTGAPGIRWCFPASGPAGG